MVKPFFRSIALLAVIVLFNTCKQPAEMPSATITGGYSIPLNTPAWVHNAVFTRSIPRPFMILTGMGSVT